MVVSPLALISPWLSVKVSFSNILLESFNNNVVHCDHTYNLLWKKKLYCLQRKSPAVKRMPYGWRGFRVTGLVVLKCVQVVCGELCVAMELPMLLSRWPADSSIMPQMTVRDTHSLRNSSNYYQTPGVLYTERDFTFVLDGLVPVRRTNMVCAGNETSLSECTFDGADGDMTCTHQNDIIIVCAGKPS